MWAQWTLSLGVAALLIIGLVAYVNHNGPTASLPTVNKSAVAEENREAAIVVGQDQAPHVVALAPGLAARVALTRAIASFMNRQVALGVINAPYQSTACGTAAGSSTVRLVFTCTAQAANVKYPFDAVVAPPQRQIIFCKHDLPPVPSMNIPVSARCR
jgi:hypothetical protein